MTMALTGFALTLQPSISVICTPPASRRDTDGTKSLFLLTFGEYLPQSPPCGSSVISYEYPLSERIRTLLRLEVLYRRLHSFLERLEPLQHHVALLLMFEIY